MMGGWKWMKSEWMVKVLLILLACHLIPTTIHAQEDPEYRIEIGGGVGLVSYQGDYNGNIFKNMQPMGSLLAKYRMNPRMAMAMNVSYGQLEGSSRDVTTYYPSTEEVNFKHSLVDIGIRYEYNFWPYGTGREYRGAKPLTPYIYIGMGVTMAKPDKTEAGLNLPLGGGVKYKMGNRTNVALEWAIHFTGNDRLDGVKDPYGIQSSGLFKNTDCYSHLRLSLTYDIWAKCKTCHNDRD